MTDMLEIIRNSKYFDAEWYCLRYPDVTLSGLDAPVHYLLIGALLQRNPGPDFSVKNYLDKNPDIKASGGSGFIHFLLHGEREKRRGFEPDSLMVDAPIAQDTSRTQITAVAKKSSEAQNSQILLTKSATARLGKNDISGDLNMSSSTHPVLRGWIAKRGDNKSQVALLQIDGNNEIEVVADKFRADLEGKVNNGFHAFDVAVPLPYVDGKEHEITLLDKETGVIVKKSKATWSHNRSFSDLAGFLANSYVNPYISRPFREEDKRCFAAMENIASDLIIETEKLRIKPLVSVIMPCYNRMETIEEAVQSVLDQTYGRFELIIIDDASTDGTLAWCRKLRDKRVKVISLKKNGGASVARNAGLKKASGTYITYLDSDNRWDSRYLSAMVGAFTRLPHADAIFSGQYIYHGANTEPSAVRFGSLNRSLLFNRNYIDMNAFCHTKASYKKLGGFDVSLKRFIDWDLILRYAQEANMFSAPVILCHYFLGKASNTITADQRNLHQLQLVREKHSISLTGDSPENTSSVLAISAGKYSLSRRVSIIIPSYEALNDLSECIESILAVTDRDMVEIIVVDNASAEPVTEYIKQKTVDGSIKSICNLYNYGFTHAVNQGISLADKRNDLILLNNDSILTNGAIEEMQKAAYELPDCGLVVPQQVLPGKTKTIGDHVPYANPEFACDVNLSTRHANIFNPPLFSNGEITELTFAPFFCVYIPRHVYERVGPLDAQHGRHYRSDRIYCDTIRHVHKLKIYHVYRSLVFHKLQKATDTLRSNRANVSNFELMFKKNQWDDVTQKSLGFVPAAWDC